MLQNCYKAISPVNSKESTKNIGYFHELRFNAEICSSERIFTVICNLQRMGFGCIL